jgi:hypothetical protein
MLMMNQLLIAALECQDDDIVVPSLTPDDGTVESCHNLALIGYAPNRLSITSTVATGASRLKVRSCGRFYVTVKPRRTKPEAWASVRFARAPIIAGKPPSRV